MEEFLLNSRDTELVKPVYEAARVTAEYGGLGIGVATVDARKKSPEGEFEGRTIIWPQSFAARLDKFEMQRMETIANTLSARVVAVELPGVGEQGAKPAPGQVWDSLSFFDLKKGNFKIAAHAMLGAVNEVVNFQENEEVEFLLFSQGVAEGAAMASELGEEAHGLKLKIPRVMMVEAVNDQPWKLSGKNGLLAKINEEDKHTDRYLKENEPYDWLVAPGDRTEEGAKERKWLDWRQSLPLYIGGAALRDPSIPILLDVIDRDKSDKVTGLSEAKFDIFKFDKSGVTRMDANQLTVQQLKLAAPLGEASFTEITGGHYHPAVHSKPNTEIIARELLTEK